MVDYREIQFDAASGGLRLHARDYGAPDAPLAVLCLHGFTRNGADFESLATHLAGRYRVICPDQRGRGRSDHDPQPERYAPPVYAQDMAVLLAHLGITRAVVVGTSMGGLVGMLMGALMPQAVSGLVLNDVGPEVDQAGLQRIRAYVGDATRPASWDEAAARAREVNAVAFPDYDEADWRAFARRVYPVAADGLPAQAYDPAITAAFAQAAAAPPPDLWPLWDSLKALPILAIRGETSDILAARTLHAMGERHPGMHAVTVPGRGHAPMLDEPVAVDAIDAFLRAREAGP